MDKRVIEMMNAVLELQKAQMTAMMGKLIPNPDRRWWQFWKPKFVYEPIPIRISDDGGSEFLTIKRPKGFGDG